MLTNILTTSYI